MLGMSFKNLKVWQKSMELVKLVYELTKSFPKEEVYGLNSQMRRAAISVASNISEGSQRTSDKEFEHFILMSRGSLAELETQRLASEMLGYGRQDLQQKISLLIEEVSRMLHSFHRKLIAQSS